MYGDTQLCWVNNGGKTRDLELWIGTRKICGFKDVCEMELLEEILHISGNVIEERDNVGMKYEELKDRVEELEAKIEDARNILED